MSEPLTLLLLDVDGVLIHDGGYRAGVTATVDHFAAQMGLRGMAPTEAEVDAFHAAGFTNEWDLCAYVVGVLRLMVAQGEGGERPDYRSWVERSRAYTGRPAQRALAALRTELSRLALPDGRKEALERELRLLLADPYDVPRSPTTQVFQEFVLGSRLYAAHYGLPSRFKTPSLLEREDRPALTPAGRATLERLVAEAGVRVCVYTARPSGPPADADGRASPLPPEAELGIRILGLERYPLIAMGRMQWLADRHGEAVEALTKPSPVQTLAALGAAVSGTEGPALEAAYALYRDGRLLPPLADLVGRSGQLFILEDAMLGLQAAAGALRLLERHGLTLRMRAVGVTPAPVKAEALVPYCEVIVPDVNAGLAWVADALEGNR